MNALDLPACSSCGAGFLAGLSGDEPGLVLPGVGNLAALRRGQRYGLAAVAACALALVVVLLLSAVGALL